MIKGMHGIFYTPKADELRTFIKEKLGFSFTDIHDGWLIFDVPQADLACHPAEKSSHDISFYCDNIQTTVEELKLKGVEFSSDISDQGWGYMTTIKMPGDIEVILYQPKYKKNSGL